MLNRLFSWFPAPARPLAGPAVGLEIRPDGLVFTRVTREAAGGLRLEQARHFPADQPGEALPCSAAHLATCAGELGLPDPRVPLWVVASCDSLRLHRVEIPAGAMGRIDAALLYALRREESFTEAETLVDYVVEEAGDAAADRPLRVCGILVPHREIQAWQDLLAAADLPVAGLVLPVFAHLNLHHLGLIPPAPGPTALVCFGQQTTAIQLVDQGHLALHRSMPTGLRTLAKTLAERLDPLPPLAEAARLVLEQPAPGQERRISPAELGAVLQPSLERVARQVEWTGDYYRSQLQGGAIERTYLTGTLAAAATVRTLLDAELGARATEFMPPPAGPLHVAPDLELPATDLMLALGAALSDPEGTPNLRRTQAQRRLARQGRRLQGLALVLITLLLVGGGLFYALQAAETGLLRQERDSRRAILAGGSEVTEALVMGRLSELSSLNQRVEGAIRRHHPLATLSLVHELTPEHVRLNDVTVRRGADPGATHRARLEGVLTGEAATLETLLTLYVQSLERSPLLGEVKIERSERLRSAGAPRLFFVLGAQVTDPAAERNP